MAASRRRPHRVRVRSLMVPHDRIGNQVIDLRESDQRARQQGLDLQHGDEEKQGRNVLSVEQQRHANGANGPAEVERFKALSEAPQHRCNQNIEAPVSIAQPVRPPG